MVFSFKSLDKPVGCGGHTEEVTDHDGLGGVIGIRDGVSREAGREASKSLVELVCDVDEGFDAWEVGGGEAIFKKSGRDLYL